MILIVQPRSVLLFSFEASVIVVVIDDNGLDTVLHQRQ